MTRLIIAAGTVLTAITQSPIQWTADDGIWHHGRCPARPPGTFAERRETTLNWKFTVGEMGVFGVYAKSFDWEHEEPFSATIITLRGESFTQYMKTRTMLLATFLQRGTYTVEVNCFSARTANAYEVELMLEGPGPDGLTPYPLTATGLRIRDQ